MIPKVKRLQEPSLRSEACQARSVPNSPSRSMGNPNVESLIPQPASLAIPRQDSAYRSGSRAWLCSVSLQFSRSTFCLTCRSQWQFGYFCISNRLPLKATSVQERHQAESDSSLGTLHAVKQIDIAPQLYSLMHHHRYCADALHERGLIRGTDSVL